MLFSKYKYTRQFAYVYDLNLCLKTWKKLQVHAQQSQYIYIYIYYAYNLQHINYHTS